MPTHDTPVSLHVQHALYGEGVVVAWRRGGRAAVVSFAQQPLPMEVPVRELSQQPGASGRPLATQAQALAGPRLEGTMEHGAARLTLEAMRLGVVPSARLDAYTVGRDFEMALVDSDLDTTAAQGAVRAFLGDYGVGKTHLLELVQQRALERGFLTARVVLDPEETSPAHPKRVYRAAVRALRYPDRPYEEDVGLAPLLDRAAQSDAVLDAFGLATRRRRAAPVSLDDAQHLYLTPAIAYVRSLAACSPERTPRQVPPADVESWVERARELLFDWLEGHPTISNQVIDKILSKVPGQHPRIYSLLDYRPWARIYGYLLSGLAKLARAAGYEGLVLLIDEAEFYGLLSPENRAYARVLFKAWAWAAVGGTNGEPDGVLPFDASELELGGAGVQKRLPPRFGSSGLYVVFAMTPHADGLDALRGAIPSRAITQLGHLEPVDFTELARRVCDFYASAFPDWSFPATLVGPLSKVLLGLIQSGYVTNPRQAMKFILEFLDVVRYYPDRVPGVVRNLQENLLF